MVIILKPLIYIRNGNLYKIPIYLIKEFLFCQRIPFFINKLNINPAQPLWMEQGKSYEKKQKILMCRRTLKRFNLDKAKIFYNVELNSEDLDFYGICDMIIIDEEKNLVIPVEFKLKTDKKFKNHFYQLCCYGILSEKIFNKKFNKGFVLFSDKGKTIPFDFSENDKIKCLKIIKEIKEIIENDLIPATSATIHKCYQCEYKNFCNDRL